MNPEILTRCATALAEPIERHGARIRFGFPFWLRPLVGRRILAITLGRRIFVAHSLVAMSEERIAAILRHELVHVQQAADLGLARFLFLYLSEYFRHRRSGLPHEAAYRAIRFEREAFAAENEKVANSRPSPL